jgi:hypothetical protein
MKRFWQTTANTMPDFMQGEYPSMAYGYQFVLLSGLRLGSHSSRFFSGREDSLPRQFSR